MALDPLHEATTITLGGKERTILFTPRAMRVAQRLLDGRDPRIQLSRHCGQDTVHCCAAAGMATTDTAVDVARIDEWIEREPLKYPELEDAVLVAAHRYFVAIGLAKAREVAPGEAKQP